jgi:uncharacterized membrane protein
MSIDPLALLTIAGMAVATYVTRAGGLWLMGRVPMSSRAEAGLRHIPGAVLVALIAPAVFTRSANEVAATAVTILIAARTKNLLFAMIAGVLAVFVLRRSM